MVEIDRIKTVEIENPRLKFGIDRDEENQDVKEYIKTGNQIIFNRIYHRRKPTIEYLAKKYYWLTEDAASEIRIVLVRTVNSYGKNGKKTDFNTFFYSSVKNHFSNLAKKRYRKKRTTIDGLDPLNRMIQLDSCVGDDESSSSFHELISNDDEAFREDMNFKDLLAKISKGNKYIASVLSEIRDMTRREISNDKELIFSFLFPVISGEISIDIATAIGIPEDVYNIVSVSIESDKIHSRICVNGKKFISYIAGCFPEIIEASIKNKGN